MLELQNGPLCYSYINWQYVFHWLLEKENMTYDVLMEKLHHHGCIWHITSILVVMLHLRPLRSTDHRGATLTHVERRYASAVQMEQALILCDVTAKVLVKCCTVKCSS